MKDTRRIGYIDVYRGFGIIFMLMGHVGFGEKFDYWVHAFHMPMWFIVSGYFFTGKETGRAYIKKKIMQLLVPYFSFGGGTTYYGFY